MPQPDPNPVSLSLPWGGDLQLAANGSLVFVSGIAKLRERIIRRFFTAPEQTLADGDYYPADYIFDLDYGLGASRLVGEPMSDEIGATLRQRVRNAVLIDEGVDSTQEPAIQLFATQNGVVYIQVLVTLLNQTRETLNFPVPGKLVH